MAAVWAMFVRVLLCPKEGATLKISAYSSCLLDRITPHLHHVIQTVEDVFSCLLRLDAHLCLVLCRCLQKKEPQQHFST